jgi:hypothetical protein
MGINNISNNQILNNPTLQRPQTQDTQTDTGNTGSQQTGSVETEQNPSNDTVSLTFGAQSFQTQGIQGNEPPISAQEAQNAANAISQSILGNPQQAVQVFGAPDYRAVQSLLSAA